MEKYKDIYSKYFKINGSAYNIEGLYKVWNDFEAELKKLAQRVEDLNVQEISHNIALIEVKSSNELEGIINTLPHTGLLALNKEDKTVRPLSIGMLEESKVDRNSVDMLASLINHAEDRSQRFLGSFGIYASVPNSKVAEKIYEPLLDANKLEKEYEKFWKMINTEWTPLVCEIIAHIWFEKIHPYVDGNGRIGRYILEKRLVNGFNYYFDQQLPSILPISYTALMNKEVYYDLFDVEDNINIIKYVKALTISVQKISKYLKEHNDYIKSNISKIKEMSSKIDDDMARWLLTNFVTIPSIAQGKLKLDRKTIRTIYNKMNEIGIINVVSKGRHTYYFNIDIEDLINKVFFTN